MREIYKNLDFINVYKYVSKELRSPEQTKRQSIRLYFELFRSLEILLHRMAIDLGIKLKRPTMGILAKEVGKECNIPPIISESLGVIVTNRNIIAHTPSYSDSPDNFIADLDAVQNFYIWFLSDYKLGPSLSRTDAENYLHDDIASKEEIKISKSVFLSYATEDEKKASSVYDALIKRGHHPWMDKRDLIAGQDWEAEIRKAIRKSESFVALMSNRSVNKRGFVQKEIRFALDVLDEIPPGQIYFIPVRLEPCEVPDAIRNLHWTDLTSDTYDDLFKAIEYTH